MIWEKHFDFETHVAAAAIFLEDAAVGGRDCFKGVKLERV